MSPARKFLTPARTASALLLAALLGVCSAAAAPQVRVGDAGGGRVEIEAHNASVRDVLDALKASHMIQFRSSDALSRVVTGTYRGTLPQVLSRMLEGYNYVLQVTPSETLLRIVDTARSDKTSASIISGFAAPPTVRAISGNVDADDEKAEDAAAPSSAHKAAALRAPSTVAPGPMITAHPSAGNRVSTNVDLDEENSR